MSIRIRFLRMLIRFVSRSSWLATTVVLSFWTMGAFCQTDDDSRRLGDVAEKDDLYSVFNADEFRFARWDSTFGMQIPGHGPTLPIDTVSLWRLQWLPNEILYRAYFASNREARMGIHFVHEDKQDREFWDPTIGGKVPILRYGNHARLYPEGVQLDLEAAAIPRLTLDHDRDLYGTDYRFGVPLSWRQNGFEAMIGYYHISSHLGDEWLVRHYTETGDVWRINYVRDCVMFGGAYRPDANWRFYVGGDYGFNTDGGAEPWQFVTGAEYSPMILPGIKGSPFMACHLKWNEECNWETYAAFEAGWQWKWIYQQTFRTGLYLMSGSADQYQFFRRHEKQVGWGFWFDF